MKKQSNKKIKPLIPNPSGNYFDPQFQQMGQSSFLTSGIPQQFNSKINTAGLDYSLMGPKNGLAAMPGAGAASGGLGAAAGAIGAVPGVMNLLNTSISDFDTSGIGKEVVGTSQMSRGDILNTNVNVDSNQKGAGAIGSDALSAAMTGMQVAGPWGALAGLVPIATGIFGNEKKRKAADAAEQQ